jgi:hypothetical protein
MATRVSLHEFTGTATAFPDLLLGVRAAAPDQRQDVWIVDLSSGGVRFRTAGRERRSRKGIDPRHHPVPPDKAVVRGKYCAWLDDHVYSVTGPAADDSGGAVLPSTSSYRYGVVMARDATPGDSAREFYRIAYPAKARPRLHVSGFDFEVLDLSERGIRFRLGEAMAPEAGISFAAPCGSSAV